MKRTEGDTIEERLTANAYHNILPARYLRKNADGDLTRDAEELFAASQRTSRSLKRSSRPTSRTSTYTSRRTS